jgi:hypothetical protein
MRHIILTILLFCSLQTFSQENKHFSFDLTVFSEYVNITNQTAFYVTTNSDTIIPKVNKDIFEFTFADSVVDFHLLIAKRHFLFKGIETYRLLRNCYWEIKLDSAASDSSYQIMVDRAGCFSNVIVGGNYYLSLSDNSIRSNKIRLKSYSSSLLLDRHRQNIKVEHEKLHPSDSMIMYLPGFKLDSVELPDTSYESYSIMCFGKGYSYTSDLDKIEVCDCRIYPKDNSTSIKRAYWRAFREKDNIWKREYYSNNKEIVKTDYIIEILPYEIIHEKIVNDLNNNSCVLIYQYYKTKTIDRIK